MRLARRCLKQEERSDTKDHAALGREFGERHPRRLEFLASGRALPEGVWRPPFRFSLGDLCDVSSPGRRQTDQVQLVAFHLSLRLGLEVTLI